jgi:energy-dependent translational throttle protein EttA
MENLNFIIPPGAIVGVLGPNGAGKSTFMKMVLGKETPDSGEIKIGHTVKLAAVDQSRHLLTDSNTVWQEVSGGADIITIGKYELQSRAYIGRFNFKGSDQQKLVGSLSGGERGRLHLAKTLMSGGNVLLLDCWHSQAAPLWFHMIVGSWIESRHTFWPLRVIRKLYS